MSDLRDLYQEIIVEHSRHPRNFGANPKATHKAEGFNPLCGDKLTLYLEVENGNVKNVNFEGSGCAISTASASMMTESIRGKSIQEAESLFNAFRGLVTERKESSSLGKLTVFEGVSEFPARVKCAILCWHTLKNALGNQHDLTTTE